MAGQLLTILLTSILAQTDGSRNDVAPVGVVSHVKILSDKVPDVANMEAWKKSFLRAGMSDQEKALAVWRSTVMFQHQDAPPNEFLQHEGSVQDPIKIFNVYGYSFCSVACSDVAALARYAGLKVRGWGINGHSVPEVYWDRAWHMLDASLINYFPKESGGIASVEEIMAAVQQWHDQNPGYKGNEARLVDFQKAAGWTGWRRGPKLLARNPFLDAGGWWPAHSHGWYSAMQEYDGTYGKKQKPFLYEYGYSQGYQVNVQLRPGERLTRNWSNKGLHVNKKDGGAPGCLTMKTGTGSLAHTPKFGDIAPGRVGNGTLEYDVPVGKSIFAFGTILVENLEDQCARVKDPARPGVLVLRMPSSYVYLTGTLTFGSAMETGGRIVVCCSDNNGLDWKEIARTTSPGAQRVDLTPLVLRRYDYRLKFELHGKGTRLDTLRVVQDIQHSQRALPALAQGTNTITFSAGPPEGTVTVEGATTLSYKGKQLVYTDFHPEISGFEPNLFIGSAGKGSIAFPVATPGDMVRLRFGAHYRARDARDGLDYQVSFDHGTTWKTVDRAAGPTAGDCKYTIYGNVPSGTRQALVRYAGTNRNATGLLNFRIDADYREPCGGFRPVQVTYTWEENGQTRQDIHTALKAQETYTIHCASQPVMKSIVVEVAE
jgi:hypothetical protein